jgi:hypothetical protein
MPSLTVVSSVFGKQFMKIAERIGSPIFWRAEVMQASKASLLNLRSAGDGRRDWNGEAASAKLGGAIILAAPAIVASAPSYSKSFLLLGSTNSAWDATSLVREDSDNVYLREPWQRSKSRDEQNTESS